MRPLTSTTALLAATLCARSALPCGAPFGDQFTLDPAQKILLVFDGATETYVFSPTFCGEAAEFGLILPVPAALTGNPALAEPELFDELDAISAPTVEVVQACPGVGCGAGIDGAAGGNEQEFGKLRDGVDVVDQGQVGIFDWVLLQATTPAAFTDWLDTQGFPYDAAAAPHFDYYVSKAWYFVAFRVTAGEQAPPAGSRLCGELGPIQLQFGAPQPVVPTRITQTDGTDRYEYFWRIFAVGADQYQLGDAPGHRAELYFAGDLDSAALAGRPNLAALASAGLRLTALDTRFTSGDIEVDLVLVPDSDGADFRATVYEYTDEDCGVCSALPSVWFSGALALLPLWVLARRSRGRARRRG